MVEPMRVIPKSEIVAPIRLKLRRDIVDPRWRKSSTERDEPIRLVPNSDTAEPKREKLRSDKVDPI